MRVASFAASLIAGVTIASASQASTVVTFEPDAGHIAGYSGDGMGNLIPTVWAEGLWFAGVSNPYPDLGSARLIIEDGALVVGANQIVSISTLILRRLTTIDVDGSAPIKVLSSTPYVRALDDVAGFQTIVIDQFVGRITLTSTSAWRLDNVVATSVPEPSAWGLMVAGFALAGSAFRRRAVAPQAGAVWPDGGHSSADHRPA